MRRSLTILALFAVLGLALGCGDKRHTGPLDVEPVEVPAEPAPVVSCMNEGANTPEGIGPSPGASAPPSMPEETKRLIAIMDALKAAFAESGGACKLVCTVRTSDDFTVEIVYQPEGVSVGHAAQAPNARVQPRGVDVQSQSNYAPGR